MSTSYVNYVSGLCHVYLRLPRRRTARPAALARSGCTSKHPQVLVKLPFVDLGPGLENCRWGLNIEGVSYHEPESHRTKLSAPIPSLAPLSSRAGLHGPARPFYSGDTANFGNVEIPSSAQAGTGLR